MQTLEIISINIWHIIISLCNLLILYWMVRKFLYKPVNRVFDKRKNAIEKQYASAEEAEKNALSNKNIWEEKMSRADDEAKEIITSATQDAGKRRDKIVLDAQEKAADIIKQAERQAQMEMEKAGSEIKKEIVDVSSALTEKLIGRELNDDDHRDLIDSFIEEIGGSDDGNK